MRIHNNGGCRILRANDSWFNRSIICSLGLDSRFACFLSYSLGFASQCSSWWLFAIAGVLTRLHELQRRCFMNINDPLPSLRISFFLQLLMYFVSFYHLMMRLIIIIGSPLVYNPNHTCSRLLLYIQRMTSLKLLRPAFHALGNEISPFHCFKCFLANGKNGEVRLARIARHWRFLSCISFVSITDLLIWTIERI